MLAPVSSERMFFGAVAERNVEDTGLFHTADGIAYVDTDVTRSLFSSGIELIQYQSVINLF